MVVVAGLDPAGSEKRPSGLAVIHGNSLIYISRLYSDREIIGVVREYMPTVIAIDSPLSHTIHGYREVDRVMKRLGYRVLPPSWPSMRMLVTRSLRLVDAFLSMGISVIETHPLSALKSSGCRDWVELAKKLLHGFTIDRRLSRDEIDALVAALVAKTYVDGVAKAVSARDGVIYLLPKVCAYE